MLQLGSSGPTPLRLAGWSAHLTGTPLNPSGSGFALCSGPGLQFSCVFLKPVCQHQKKAEGWAPRSPLFSHSREAPSLWPVGVCQAEVLAVGTCGSVGCPWSPVWHSTPRQTFSTCRQSCLRRHGCSERHGSPGLESVCSLRRPHLLLAGQLAHKSGVDQPLRHVR